MDTVVVRHQTGRSAGARFCHINVPCVVAVGVIPLLAQKVSAPVEVDVAVTAGIGALLDYPLELLPGQPMENDSGEVKPPSTGRLPVRIVRPREIQER